MLPNTIIAGSPRCGTTALFEYLSRHPEVSASKIKETTYFIDQDYFSSRFLQSKLPKYFSHPISEYEKYFENLNGKKKIILEASPDYLYQVEAIKSIAALKSKPQLIFILRKPSSRVYSMYKYAQGQLGILDNEMTFAEFVQKAKDTDYFSKQGLKILDDVIENGKYIKYLRKFDKYFDRKKMTIIIFEDLMQNPQKMLSKISIDLGIDGSFYDTFEARVSNNSVTVRSKFLQRILKKAPIPLLLRYGDGYLKSFFKKIYRKLNTAPVSKKSTDDEYVLKELDQEYRESTSALGREFQLDLSRWK